MKYALILACALVAGCDAVRSTTDRVFGNSSSESTAEPVATDVPEEAPELVATASGWAGAKTTVAGLGDPNTPGRWLQTPLVETEINGRVVVPRTGAQVYVALVPAPGPDGGGSRLSLEAMRALLVPFDELVELEVYSD
ncbi:hypothetical protein [uncultured Ruegeria sp.]|uniref:hypothetical protein n=1 Tax=uncultured Ruegeria sp. TaxID=259304 RepID=UPI0026161AAA|nr:hypothetical protein [uncultured Ruegeria sp.]